jgi:hypothetical protein
MENTLEIRLPTDAKLITRLELKLEEYRARMREHVAQREMNRHYDTECKIKILSELLKNKIVRLNDLEAEYAAEDPQAAPYIYNAFMVIEDYVKTGGANLSRGLGTGLPGVGMTDEQDKK